MNKPIHISIIGSCIVRDSIGFKEDETTTPEEVGYIVDRYAQKQNPISSMDFGKIISDGKSLHESGVLDMMMFSTLHDFNKRDFTLDIERNLFDYIFERQSEYLIMDMIPFRCGLFRFGNGEKTTYLTNEYNWYQTAVDELKERGYIDMDYQCVDSNDEIIPLIKERIYPYLDKLLERYPADRIILVESKPVEFYIDGNTIKTFKRSSMDQRQKRADLAFSIAKNYLKGCHIIEFPEYVIADKEHKWGLASSHYSRAYYDYLYDAYDVIMHEHNDMETEHAKLDALKDVCSEEYYGMCLPRMYDSIRRIQGKAETAERCTSYCDYYELIIRETDKGMRLLDYIKSHNYKSCAFFGYNRITKLYIDLLLENGISVDYILENSSKTQIGSIPVYRRITLKLPKTDLLIIADMIDFEETKERLESIAEIPVIGIYDIFN